MNSDLEILEYPYWGTIWHVTQGEGREPDTRTLVYEGVMDEHQTTPEEGRTLQTASYIISIPLTRCPRGCYVVPRKGDVIELNRCGEMIDLVVDNAEPSQLDGVSIYATRQSW